MRIHLGTTNHKKRTDTNVCSTEGKKEQFNFLPSGKIKIGSLFLSATCSLSLWKQKVKLKQLFFHISFPRQMHQITKHTVRNQNCLMDTNLYFPFFCNKSETLYNESFITTYKLFQLVLHWSNALPVCYFINGCQESQATYAIRSCQLTPNKLSLQVAYSRKKPATLVGRSFSARYFPTHSTSTSASKDYHV